MDLTTLYRELVRLALPESEQKPEVNKVEPDAVTQQTTEIARKINGVLASIRLIRPKYLALHPPQQLSSSEREDFDYTVRQLLEKEKRLVRLLEQKEAERASSTNQSSGLMQWLSDPSIENRSKTVSMHRQGMFICLNMRLQEASQALTEMQQILLARNVPETITHSNPETDLDFETYKPVEPEFESVFSDENGTVQMLTEEHDALLTELNHRLDQAHKAEKGLREISELQSELAQHLSQQSEQLEQMVNDAYRTEINVDNANAQLEKAKRNNRRASRIIIYSSITTGVLLLLLNGR